MPDNILNTFLELLAIGAPSTQEGKIGNYILNKLNMLGFKTEKDEIGNILGFLEGNGEALFLSAHLDRVPLGLGNKPIINGDIIKSDGTTNLGADDAAGIAIILEALKEIVENKIAHPSILVTFTVQEEIGLKGARNINLSKYNIKYGIAYDNAGKVGTLINKASSYTAFDLEIIGKSVHPGKELNQTINTFKITQEIDFMIGESEDKQTRINVGLAEIGKARNITPGVGKISGEIRSFLGEEKLKEIISKLKNNIKTICDKYHAKYKLTFTKHANAYSIDENETLAQKYKKVRANNFQANSTFIASDTSVFRGEKELKVFTISTGVENEHTVDEFIRFSNLIKLKNDLVNLIKSL